MDITNILDMATRNGASAIGVDSGALTPGTLADIVLVQDLDRFLNGDENVVHSLVDGIPVIRNGERSMDNERGQILLEQPHAMDSSIDHFLSRARIYGKKDAIGYRTSVKTVINDLVYAVDHIYRDREIEIQFSEHGEGLFRGEAQDLVEKGG